MKKNTIFIIIGSVLVLIILVLAVSLSKKAIRLKSEMNLTKIEVSQKDSIQRVLDQQAIAEAEAKALAQQQVEARNGLLQSTGLVNLQLPGIYWEWGADSASITEGIKDFKLYDAKKDYYPNYRRGLEGLTQKTFGGDLEKSKKRDSSFVDLFIKAPQIFKVIYDLNKGIIGKLKKDWELPNQGEELVKYLGSAKHPYEAHFEAFFQKHTKEGQEGVFSHDEWPALDSILQKNYPETFKSEADSRREYGHWRIVRDNFSPEAKGVLLYVLTDYNGRAAAQPAATAADINKSISDWLK